MAVYKIIFSPAGGTAAAADALCAEWKAGGLTRIDLTKPDVDFGKYSFTKDDLCIIACPVFEGRVPAMVLERLGQMHAEGTPAVFAVVYGNRHFNDALLELQDKLLELGFMPFAGVTANAQHSILHIYGTGRPDDEDKAELKEFSAKIKAVLDSGAELKIASVPGKRPYIVLPGKTACPEFDASLCTYCGRCVFQCPAQALNMEIETDANRCIRCMRCVNICPHYARFIPEERIKAASERLGKYFEGRKPNKLFFAAE